MIFLSNLVLEFKCSKCPRRLKTKAVLKPLFYRVTTCPSCVSTLNAGIEELQLCVRGTGNHHTNFSWPYLSEGFLRMVSQQAFLTLCVLNKGTVVSVSTNIIGLSQQSKSFAFISIEVFIMSGLMANHNTAVAYNI